MKTENPFDFDILILGGGAAGLTAAISAALSAGREKISIGILEKKETVGKKLAATGNGRCNLSNVHCMGRGEVDEFFSQIGLITKIDDTGRMYPHGEEASEVVALLEETARFLHVQIITGCRTENIAAMTGPQHQQGWQIGGVAADGSSFNLTAKKVLLATGGKSYSIFGATGDGYLMARKLGHQVSRLAPSLVPITVKEDISPLAGVRSKASGTLFFDGQAVACESGEVQFQKDALSGICMMNLSRLLVLPQGLSLKEGFAKYEISLDLVPEYTEEDLVRLLEKKAQSMDRLLCTLVKKKLALWLTKDMRENGVGRQELWQLAHRLKNLHFHVTGTKGWNDAQVTRGGVALEEVDEKTMASKIAQGIYFAGEVLNYDGPCGGYNLHFAWKSGVRAGRAMAEAALTERGRREKDV